MVGVRLLHTAGDLSSLVCGVFGGHWPAGPLLWVSPHWPQAAYSVLTCWFLLGLGTWSSPGHVVLGSSGSGGLLGACVTWAWTGLSPGIEGRISGMCSIGKAPK